MYLCGGRDLNGQLWFGLIHWRLWKISEIYFIKSLRFIQVCSLNQFKFLVIISYTDKGIYHNHIVLFDHDESSRIWHIWTCWPLLRGERSIRDVLSSERTLREMRNFIHRLFLLLFWLTFPWRADTHSPAVPYLYHLTQRWEERSAFGPWECMLKFYSLPRPDMIWTWALLGKWPSGLYFWMMVSFLSKCDMCWNGE